MGLFLKLSQILQHGEAFAAQILAFADKGMAIDQHLLDKARAFEATAKHVIPGLQAGPATMGVDVPQEHAAVLGAK
jgi:hypothetical protein